VRAPIASVERRVLLLRHGPEEPVTTTWVVVAHRAGARILAHCGPGTGLARVAELVHPEGRMRDRDFDADRPGRAFDSHGQGRHAMSREEPPHEHAAAEFARDLARHVDRSRQQHRFDALVLVAEPGFLGILRGALTDATAALVRGSVAKDLAKVPDRDLGDHLGALLG
jgi:protein required for attachment to host cells